MRLENWSIVPRTDSPYQAPELASQAVRGKVFGNPCFEDESFVTTSAIEHVEWDEGKPTLVYTKSGSCYELGKVDEAYEAAYPNAEKRLQQAWEGR